MSAAEVIEEIKKLPVEEQKKVFAYIKSQEETAADISDGFKQMAGEMFNKNEELFRKLAQ